MKILNYDIMPAADNVRLSLIFFHVKILYGLNVYVTFEANNEINWIESIHKRRIYPQKYVV